MPSGDDIGRHLVFEEREPIAQGELPLLESLDLKLIDAAEVQERLQGRIEVAMFLTKAVDFGLERQALVVDQVFPHCRIVPSNP